MFALKQTAAPATEPVSVSEQKAQMRVTITDDDAYIATLISAARAHIEGMTGRCMVSQSWLMVMDTFPGFNFGPYPYDQRPTFNVPPFFSLPIVPILKDPRAIVLPLAPIISVDSVITYTEDGTAATMDSGDYNTDLISEPSRIRLKKNLSWPIPAAGLAAVNGVRVAFTAGYGTSADMITAQSALTAAEALAAAADTDGKRTTALAAMLAAEALIVAAQTAAITAIPADLKAAVKLLAAHYYENREDATTLSLANIPTGVKSLIAPYKMWQRET